MLTLGFDDARSTDPRRVGGKAQGLATMTQAGIPVSPGFTLSTQAYRDYLAATGLGARLDERLRGLADAPIEALDEAAGTIAGWFDYTPLPGPLSEPLALAYAQLCERVGAADVSVAVRSSATAEDSAGASFAGEYETYVGMRGAAEVELHVRRCWASAFTPRALGYAWKNGIAPLGVDMAVVVQKTVKARAAGVMFTLSPVTGDRSRIVIEASYGLGLGVVGGEVTPDRWVVAKIEGLVLERVVGDKHLEYLHGHDATPVDHDRRVQLCLADDEVLALARIGKRLERMHGAPQDIEFAIDRDLPSGSNIVLLQCRPETIWSGRARRAAMACTPDGGLAGAVLATTRAG